MNWLDPTLYSMCEIFQKLKRKQNPRKLGRSKKIEQMNREKQRPKTQPLSAEHEPLSKRSSWVSNVFEASLPVKPVINPISLKIKRKFPAIQNEPNQSCNYEKTAPKGGLKPVSCLPCCHRQDAGQKLKKVIYVNAMKHLREPLSIIKNA